MNNFNMYVFRLAKGNGGGNPIGNCPMDYSEIKRKALSIKKEDIKYIDYENNGYLNFLHHELWSNNILRQGWGIKGLDLRQKMVKY